MAVPTDDPTKAFTMPELYEFRTVKPAIAQEIHTAVMSDLKKSYRLALINLLQRKMRQKSEVTGILLQYYTGNINHDQMIEQMNDVLAHFTGFRTFLLDRLFPLLITAGESERGRSLVLAVEESLERDMTDVFNRIVAAAGAAGIILSWTDYIGLSYRLDPSADINNEG